MTELISPLKFMQFGYAPKGSSVVMYRSRKFIHHQYFCSPDWSGGIFVSPTMAGSRLDLVELG